MRLVSSENELQMVAAMQAARTAPGNQLAAGMANSGSAPIDFGKLIAAASPMGGGGGGGGPAPSPGASMAARAPTRAMGAPEEEDEFNWGGALQGSVSTGAQWAAIGGKLGGAYGAIGGGVLGALVGGVQGGNS